MPQSRRTVRPPRRRMWREPVTSRAAPNNSSSTVVALLLGAARSLEQDRGAYSTLGHQRRFPPAATALVEQIGKRILVIAGVTCQPNNHGLVFFHPRFRCHDLYIFSGQRLRTADIPVRRKVLQISPE